MAVVGIVGVCLARCGPARFVFRPVATAASDSATVRLEAVRWTERLRGHSHATLTLTDRQGIGTAQLLDGLFDNPVLVAVSTRGPRVYCLYDFDTSVELVVLERGQQQDGFPRRVRVIVPTGDLGSRLGSQLDVAELRALLERMNDRQLMAAQRPVVDVGVISWRRGRAEIMQLLDDVFPVEPSGRWGANARGERRLDQEP
jgi:hypothetical protein